MLEFLKLNENESFDKAKAYLVDKMLIAGCYISHTILQEFFKFSMSIITLNRKVNNDLIESAYLAASSVVKVMRAKTPHYEEHVQQYLKTMQFKLNNCSDEQCRDFVLKALTNTKLEESVAIFYSEIEKCNFSKTCGTSLIALQKFPINLLPKDSLNTLLSIFERKSNHSSAIFIRIETLDVILNKYSDEVINSPEIVRKIISEIDSSNRSPENNFEFSYFAFQIIMNNINSN